MSNDRGHHIEITEDVMDYLPVELSNLLKESYLHSENLDSSSIDMLSSITSLAGLKKHVEGISIQINNGNAYGISGTKKTSNASGNNNTSRKKKKKKNTSKKKSISEKQKVLNLRLYASVKIHNLDGMKKILETTNADVNYIHDFEDVSFQFEQKKSKGIATIDENKKHELQINNTKFETCLMTAIDQKHMDITEILVNAGANVHYQSHLDGYTPFLIACYHGNAKLGEYLLSHGAKIDVKLKNGRNALHLLITCRGASQRNALRNVNEDDNGEGDSNITLQPMKLFKRLLNRNKLSYGFLNAQTNDNCGGLFFIRSKLIHLGNSQIK